MLSQAPHAKDWLSSRANLLPTAYVFLRLTQFSFVDSRIATIDFARNLKAGNTSWDRIPHIYYFLFTIIIL